MIKNYLKIALRNLFKQKAYSIINVSGLGIGIASCLLVYIVVKYETGYDTFQPDYGRIARVVTKHTTPDEVSYSPGVPFGMVDAVRTDFTAVKSGAIFSSFGSQVAVVSNTGAPRKFIETTGIFFSEPQFFEVFHYDFLVGDYEVLAEPGTVILTRDMATKYFGDWKAAMGKYLKVDNVVTLRVSAIIENPPLHSDFPLKVIGSFLSVKAHAATYGYHPGWNGVTSNFQVYMLLPANVKATAINNKLAASINRYYGNKSKNPLHTGHYLQPLSEVHFDTRFSTFGDHITSRSKLLTLSLIGILIIAMACINFINLSTAKAITRSKEVGVRKVLGGSRLQLFWQMMGETAMVVLAASFLALAIAELAMPYIKNIMSIQEQLTLFRPDILLAAVVGMMLVTFLSGIYPSLILSGFTPALALKNKITSATIGGISLRRGLVVTQFAISQVLIIGTVVAVSQMDFISKADLGFNKDAVLVLNANTDSLFLTRADAFKQTLLRTPGVQSVSLSSDVPSSDNSWDTNFAYDHRPDANFPILLKFADPDYFKTFGLKMLAGRPYRQSDTVNEVVVNEAVLRKLHVKDAATAIGKQIRLGSGQWKNIVGVVQDFKTSSLREGIKPLYLAATKKNYSVTSIKLRSANMFQLQSTIQAQWDKFFPEYANITSFMDENIQAFYQQENQLSLVYKIFAGIAIFISCLGLYGLVSFMAVQRTKEVGIRKVLGASVSNIVYLFSKEFTLLVIVAFVIASPIAYYLMHNWLSNFAFRIDIGIGVFAIAILSSVVIAWLTVGVKAVNAALANPVKSLRSE